MKILTLATITLLTHLMGNVVHTSMEIDPSHGIYPTTMCVYETETIEGKITLIDGAGNTWELYQYPEDYMVGDYVALIMDDNGTPNYIYDDIILDIRATGFWR